MKLRNTSGIPTETVLEVILFVRPSGISNFDVMVKKATSARYGGRAYHRGSGYHMTADPFVTVKIGPDRLFPYFEKEKHGAYLPVGLIANRVEALVMVLS